MITVIIKDPTGKEIGSFEANDTQSIVELASMHGIDIPVACGSGVCGVCLCEVEAGGKFIQPDKIATPLMPLPNDENGNPKEILACVAGVKTQPVILSETQGSKESSEQIIILQKKY